MATLKAAGLEEMHTESRQFDPYLHEAVKTEDGEDGKILAVVQKGYMFKGKVLRHAKVIVGRKPERTDKE
ncbi:Protein GrpE [uncultured archaeon]|nr:Protein GrpE [uncultured archaeon]